ncbi:MAG: GNAT family N-acetyltransferase [Anaerolineales bacterium]
MPEITFRPGTLDDSYTAFQIFEYSVLDLSQRLGVMAITGGGDPAVLEKLWESRRPLFEHLGRTAEHFWIAEAGGQAIGYARSILRDGVRELTEFFVLPSHQSGGVGRELLARAFPREGAEHRTIIATSDSRALARYLKTGVYARFPIYSFSRTPEAAPVATDLSIEPVSAAPEILETLAVLDAAVLGHRRDVDHAFLLEERQGYVYYRGRRPVGYGYVGFRSGPFALLNEEDFPAVLAHAETQVAARGSEFGVEVPLINRAAVNYLLARGYRMDTFFTFFMSDAPLGKFENYLFTSPPFFM